MLNLKEKQIMSHSLIPFESSNLPAHLAGVDIAALNADLMAHAGGGFPVISIKGKVFAVVRDGERVVLPNPKDPDSPATSIEVVLVKANKDKSKVFYINKYDPNASDKAQKPDCYSANGSTPAADAEHKQATSCAVCPHNAWGSAVNDKGIATKGKACQDSVRIAVVPNGQLNDPHLIRVPPASIKSLGEYGQMLAKRGVAYNMVVTKIAFDQEAESPKLTFKPMGFLSAEDYAQVKETLESQTTEDIVGVAGLLGQDAPAEGATPAEPSVPVAPAAAKVEAPAEPAPAPTKPKATPKPKVEPKPEPVKAIAPVVDEDPDLDIDGIDFDD
jgi:hypothetical protein